MAVAMIYPAKEQGKKTSVLNTEVSGEYVKKARTVIAWGAGVRRSSVARTVKDHVVQSLLRVAFRAQSRVCNHADMLAKFVVSWPLARATFHHLRP